MCGSGVGRVVCVVLLCVGVCVMRLCDVVGVGYEIYVLGWWGDV